MDDDDTDSLSPQTHTLALPSMSLVLPESHQQFQVHSYTFSRTILANHGTAHLASAQHER